MWTAPVSGDDLFVWMETLARRAAELRITDGFGIGDVAYPDVSDLVPTGGGTSIWGWGRIQQTPFMLADSSNNGFYWFKTLGAAWEHYTLAELLDNGNLAYEVVSHQTRDPANDSKHFSRTCFRRIASTSSTSDTEQNVIADGMRAELIFTGKWFHRVSGVWTRDQGHTPDVLCSLNPRPDWVRPGYASQGDMVCFLLAKEVFDVMDRMRVWDAGGTYDVTGPNVTQVNSQAGDVPRRLEFWWDDGTDATHVPAFDDLVAGAAGSSYNVFSTGSSADLASAYFIVQRLNVAGGSDYFTAYD